MLDPAAPQLVVNSRTLYFSWLPADPDAVAALVPPGLCPRPDRQVFLNQYIVDDETQTSGFGAYSLTYLGVSLLGVDAPGGLNAGGWWTHYVASSRLVREYAVARGAPVLAGRTRIDVNGEDLLSETEIDGHAVDPGPVSGGGDRPRDQQWAPPLLHPARRPVAQLGLPVRRRAGRPVRGRVGGVPPARPPDVRAAPGQPADHRLRLLLDRARRSPTPAG